MNSIQIVRQNDWLRRFAASAVAVTLACGPLQAHAQRVSPIDASQESAGPSSPTAAIAAIDPAMLERANKKLREAVAIADHFVPEATAAGLGDSWRMTMITNLMKGSQANFANVASAKTLGEARLAAIEVAAAGFTSGERSKTLGSVTKDLLFTPMTPCRLVDTTQTGGGGALTAGEVRTYFYTANYGSTGCSPDLVAGAGSTRPAAMAVNINVLALSSSFANVGYLAAYPEGGSPSTAWMTYKFGDVIANAGTMPFNQSTGNYNIFVQFGTHIKIDVFGVFSSPEATALDCNTQTASGNTNTSVQAFCGTGYTRTGGGCDGFSTGAAGTAESALQESYPIANGWTCWNSKSTGAFSITAHAVCCRVPGR